MYSIAVFLVIVSVLYFLGTMYIDNSGNLYRSGGGSYKLLKVSKLIIQGLTIIRRSL